MKLASRMIPRAAKSSDVEAGHVVSADVLDDLSAAFGDLAVGLDDLHADNRIPGVSEVPFQWAADARGESAANGRSGWQGRIDGQKLSMLREGFRDFPESHTGLKRGGEVGVVVGDDAVDAGHVNDNAGTGRDAAEIDPRTSASWEDGGMVGVGAFYYAAQMILGRRRDHFEGFNFVDGPAGGHF